MSDRAAARNVDEADLFPEIGNGAPTSLQNVVLEIPKRFLRLAVDQLPPGVSVLVCPPKELEPEFVRLPAAVKGARCSVTGLSRSELTNLLDEAGTKIKTSYLRKKGATKGITLIHRDSLVAFVLGKPPRPARNSEASHGRPS